jgi:hypothetical protein
VTQAAILRFNPPPPPSGLACNPAAQGVFSISETVGKNLLFRLEGACVGMYTVKRIGTGSLCELTGPGLMTLHLFRFFILCV